MLQINVPIWGGVCVCVRKCIYKLFALFFEKHNKQTNDQFKCFLFVFALLRGFSANFNGFLNGL